MTLRTTTHDADGDARARSNGSARCCARATSSCSTVSSAPARRCWPRASRSRSASHEPVVSPTFTVVREYDAPTPLVHVDVYRLDHLQELHDLGFDDLVGGEAVTVVEWGDRVERGAPERAAPGAARAGRRRRRPRRVGRRRRPHLGRASRRAGRGRGRLTCCCSRSTRRPRRCRSPSATAARCSARCSSPAVGVTPSSSRPRSSTCAASAAWTSATSPRSRSGTGPGLFTGLRVGVTTAKVMAQALRIPVVGVPSLDLVAYPLRHSGRAIVAVLDARRREVFAARYQPVPGGVQRVSDYAVHAPAELVADLARRDRRLPPRPAARGRRHRAVPSRVRRARARRACAGPEFAAPSVAALVALATARAEREEFEQPADLRPLYLRQSDAEIAWGARTGTGVG